MYSCAYYYSHCILYIKNGVFQFKTISNLWIFPHFVYIYKFKYLFLCVLSKKKLQAMPCSFFYMFLLHCALTGENDPDRHQENLEIRPHTALTDVLQIAFHPLLKVRVVITTHTLMVADRSLHPGGASDGAYTAPLHEAAAAVGQRWTYHP